MYRISILIRSEIPEGLYHKGRMLREIPNRWYIFVYRIGDFRMIEIVGVNTFGKFRMIENRGVWA